MNGSDWKKSFKIFGKYLENILKDFSNRNRPTFKMKQEITYKF